MKITAAIVIAAKMPALKECVRNREPAKIELEIRKGALEKRSFSRYNKNVKGINNRATTLGYPAHMSISMSNRETATKKATIKAAEVDHKRLVIKNAHRTVSEENRDTTNACATYSIGPVMPVKIIIPAVKM